MFLRLSEDVPNAPVWVNMDRVIAVRPEAANKSRLYIVDATLAIAAGEFIVVHEPPDEIAHKMGLLGGCPVEVSPQ